MTSKKSRSKCAFLDGETPFTNPWDGWYFPRSSSRILLAFTAGKSESNRLKISIPLRWIHHQPQETLGTIRVPDFGPGTRNAARLCDFPLHPRRVWGETRFVAGLGGLKTPMPVTGQSRFYNILYIYYTPIFKIDFGLKLCPWFFVGTFHSKTPPSHGSWTLTTLELGLAPGSGGEEDNVDVERTQLVVQLLQQATYAFEGWVLEDPARHKFGRFIKAFWRVYPLVN